MGAKTSREAPLPELVRERISTLPRRFRPESANGLSAEWELRVGSGAFAISVADHACFVREGHAESPQAVISTEPATWLAIDQGMLGGGQAFLDNRLAVEGNLDLAVRLQTLFVPYKRPRTSADLDQVEIEADGVTLSCYMVGQGPPMVLLHGLGATKISWLPVLPVLAERYRVIVPDLPGHGGSDKPKEADYSPRYYARVVRHLLDAADIEEAVLVGNSMGGRIALEMGLRSPARVSAMALLSAAVPGFRWRYLFGFTKVFPTEFGAIPFPIRERWMKLVLRRLFAHPDRLPEGGYTAAANEFIRIYRSSSARVAFFMSLRHILTEAPDPFFRSLRRIKQPVLVLFGEHDRLVPPRLGVRLAQHLPNSELVVLPEVGHVPQFEATEDALTALNGFLARLPSAAAGR